MSHEATVEHPSRFGMARSRGGVTGPLLMLLGVWGAIIPFIGHYFSYGFTPDVNWHWTAARAWLEVLPGGATFIAGALITSSRDRISATFAGWTAVAAGAWFVLGTTFDPLWNAGYLGTPSGDATQGVFERLGMFDGLGVVIVILAAFAIGRFSVVGIRDVQAVQARRDDAEEPETVEAQPRQIDMTSAATKPAGARRSTET